jgi:4-hydroxy-tetrahydrodipicolinate reductase
MAEAICTAAESRVDVSIIALAGPEQPRWDSAAPWFPGLDELPQLPDLLIDFTLPQGTGAAASWCAANKVPLLSGVTGLPADMIAKLRETAASQPVLWSANLCLGINLLADLAGRAAAVLGSATNVSIEDIHHQWKKDAPSGTALMLGEIVSEASGDDRSSIDYESIREGEVIGQHTVTFRMAGEEISLIHRADDRSIYANGALEAGLWLTTQGPGLYSAKDWLASR